MLKPLLCSSKMGRNNYTSITRKDKTLLYHTYVQKKKLFILLIVYMTEKINILKDEVLATDCKLLPHSSFNKASVASKSDSFTTITLFLPPNVSSIVF